VFAQGLFLEGSIVSKVLVLVSKVYSK